MRALKHILFVSLVVSGAAACAGSSAGKVEQVYKPGAKNVFTVKGKDQQATYKSAREHCENKDFEVLKRERVKEGEANLEMLEFRCI